jgi:hypothetical protein
MKKEKKKISSALRHFSSEGLAGVPAAQNYLKKMMGAEINTRDLEHLQALNHHVEESIGGELRDRALLHHV